jgi:hypothetical protein
MRKKLLVKRHPLRAEDGKHFAQYHGSNSSDSSSFTVAASCMDCRGLTGSERDQEGLDFVLQKFLTPRRAWVCGVLFFQNSRLVF